MKRRINPIRIVQTIQQNFKDVLTKPKRRNLILTLIAIAKTEKLRINQISRNLPVAVGHIKSRQTRFMRFLKTHFPLQDVISVWTKLVLMKAYKHPANRMAVLVDEVDLLEGYKALVAAIPFRKRAIPISFKVFTNQQIRDMVYMSKNHIIHKFMHETYEMLQKALSDTMIDREPVFIFDRGFADVKFMKYLESSGIQFVIRVCKNAGVEISGEVRRLKDWKEKRGHLGNVLYHKREQVKLHLFCGETEGDSDDERLYIVSNQEIGLCVYYGLRMDIEECFRDIKTLFGFKHLRLKCLGQERVERLLLFVIMGMGMLFLLYEKSGYRWQKSYNSGGRKEYSLIRVIAEVVRVSWAGLVTSPWFSLSDAVFF